MTAVFLLLVVAQLAAVAVTFAALDLARRAAARRPRRASTTKEKQ